MADLFDTPGEGEAEVPRDRYGRPLIVPPEGEKPTPYTRCTTLAGTLDDNYNLSRWQQRMVAIGLVDNPELVLAAGAHRDDKEKLNEICGTALDGAKARRAAGIGTALHAITERIDRGEPLGTVPEAYRADLEAYQRATACLEMLDIESFVVCDELKTAGTPDRRVQFMLGKYIADVKTGNIEYGALKIAMQLAIYSRSSFYDPVTHERTPLDVDQDRALVIHLPAGQGRCELHWIDINAGWEAVQVATQVRAWRARRGLMAPFTQPVDDIETSIAAATTVDALLAVWRKHQARWTDELTALAAAKKTLLLGGVS